MAAEQESTEAQVYLGVMYTKGDGVEKDNDEAAYWLNRAARKGSITAQRYLEKLSAKTTKK